MYVEWLEIQAASDDSDTRRGGVPSDGGLADPPEEQKVDVIA